MTGMRLASSLTASFMSSLLMFSVHAAPLTPEASAPSPSPPGSVQPAPSQPPAQPYYPPPAPGAYPPPAPGVYQPAPMYPPPLYYPQPYYSPPTDTRPSVLDYDPAKPIPAGYHLESRVRKGMVIPGSIIFGISYVIALGVGVSTTECTPSIESSSSYYSSSGCGSNNSSSSIGVPFNNYLLFVPVLGPWLALATVKDCPSYSSSSGSSYSYSCDTAEASVWRGMLALGGLTQVVGAGLMVAGLAARTRQLVLTEHVSASVWPVPMGRSGQGLAMVGSFGGL